MVARSKNVKQYDSLSRLFVAGKADCMIYLLCHNVIDNWNNTGKLDLLQVFVSISNLTLTFNLKTYRSSLHHKHSGERG